MDRSRAQPDARAKPFPVSAATATTAPSVASSGGPDGSTAVHSQDAVTEVIVREGSWEPVAVPPPTYTMKAKADRPAGPPVGALVPDSDSAPVREPIQPAVAIDDLDLDSVLDRRRAAGA
jgi:hypothetical protein